MKFDFNINTDALVANIDYLQRGIQGLKQEAALRVAESIMQESIAMAPVDTGTMVSTNYIELDGTGVKFGYAGDDHDAFNEKSGAMASEYIVQQHEDLSIIHPHGQAKFLEIPIENHRKEAEEMFAEDFENLFSNWTPKWRGRGKPRGKRR